MLTSKDLFVILLSLGTICDWIYFFHFLINRFPFLELTVGYESNLRRNTRRKKQLYRELVQQINNDYEKVNFVNLSISALGTYDKSTADFIDMMNMLKFDTRATNYTDALTIDIEHLCYQIS